MLQMNFLMRKVSVLYSSEKWTEYHHTYFKKDFSSSYTYVAFYLFLYYPTPGLDNEGADNRHDDRQWWDKSHRHQNRANGASPVDKGDKYKLRIIIRLHIQYEVPCFVCIRLILSDTLEDTRFVEREENQRRGVRPLTKTIAIHFFASGPGSTKQINKPRKYKQEIPVMSKRACDKIPLSWFRFPPRKVSAASKCPQFCWTVILIDLQLLGDPRLNVSLRWWIRILVDEMTVSAAVYGLAPWRTCVRYTLLLLDRGFLLLLLLFPSNASYIIV